MKELFSLGEIYPSDFLKDGEEPTTEKVELKLIMDDDGLVRLEKTAPMNKMYGKYWYRSGINSTMKEALKDVVDSILKIHKLKDKSIWVDIAANDGTLLSFVPENLLRVAIDPADDTYKNECINHCDLHVQNFFSKVNYYRFATQRKASVVTSIAIFYDVPDPKQFIKDVYDILEDDGLWVMQLSYSPLMINQNAFDNICHEHIYYYNGSDISLMLEPIGFYIDDVELNEVNGGSMRLYIRKYQKDKEYKLTTTASIRRVSLFAFERRWNYWDDSGEHAKWIQWFDSIKALKEKTLRFIQQAKQSGQIVWAYGASTKGNTLLQYFELDNSSITAIADRNPSKYGLRTIGSNIPIKSEEEMRKAKPDYLLILPWHFKKEFIEREKEYLQGGGKMIFPCPTFEII